MSPLKHSWHLDSTEVFCELYVQGLIYNLINDLFLLIVINDNFQIFHWLNESLLLYIHALTCTSVHADKCCPDLVYIVSLDCRAWSSSITSILRASKYLPSRLWGKNHASSFPISRLAMIEYMLQAVGTRLSGTTT